MAFDQFHQDPAHIAAVALIPPKMRKAGIVTWDAYCTANDARATSHLPHPGQRQSLMRQRAQRHPLPFIDETGELCLRVPLDGLGMRFALVFASDWLLLQEGGWHGLWCVNADKNGRLTVKARRPMSKQGPANEQTVARITLDLGPDAKALFINGDSLDLRRPNLTTKGARGLYPARDTARPGIAEARAMAT